ncbi:MAG: Arm DNA-binding domain-containing protein [Acidiferrobacteraceae bacterium]
MALTDTKPQRLQAKERAWQLADGGGLYVEVQPTGKRVWRRHTGSVAGVRAKSG